MSQWSHTLNEAVFNNNLFFYDILYKNSDYAIIESGCQEVYLYNQVGSTNKIKESEARKLLLTMRASVSGVRQHFRQQVLFNNVNVPAS